jgi:hypothetical protein
MSVNRATTYHCGIFWARDISIRAKGGASLMILAKRSEGLSKPNEFPENRFGGYSRLADQIRH